MRQLALSLWVLACACGEARVVMTPKGGGEELTQDFVPGPKQTTPLPSGVLLSKGAPYPVVLAHGFFGFDDFAGVKFVNYFFGVRADLSARGEKNVFTPAVDPFNDSEYRGAQLLEEVKKVLAQTGHAKVVLIGHSQGGLDARWVAHTRPDLVAAVVTISTPHKGTKVADVFDPILSKPEVSEVIDELVRLVGAPLWDELTAKTALSKPLGLFTTAGTAAFNAKVKDAAGVRYFSIAGRSGLRLGGSACAVPSPPPFIKKWEWTVDTTNPMLKASELLLEESVIDPKPNDGLVAVEQAKWGEFLGCIPADHLDQIGHLVGAPAGLGNAWEHKVFYRELIGWLRGLGY